MILKILYAPVEPFVLHPELAVFMAVGFGILTVVCILRSGKFRPVIHFVMLLAALGWVLFGVNEYQAQAEGRNIRVDIFFSWPILLAVSVASAWLGIRGLAEECSTTPPADETPPAK